MVEGNNMSELATFLENEPVEQPEAEAQADTEAQPEPEATEATAEQETTGEKQPEAEIEAQGEGSTPEPQDSEADKPLSKAEFAGMLAEREKRQKYQQEAEQLRQQLAQLQTPTKQTPDVFEDQEGFVSSMRAEMQQELTGMRAEMSREMMRVTHQDYDETEQKFWEMAQENPVLAEQALADRNPAKFTYDAVKKAEKLAEMENVDDYRAKVRAEIEAEVRAEMEAGLKAQIEDRTKKADQITPSLSGQRAAGGNTAPTVEVPDPLETTFNR